MGWAVYYTKQSEEITIGRCIGDGSPLELPEQIDGLPVGTLGVDCFGGGNGTESGFFEVPPEQLPPLSRDNSNLSRIVLPDCVHTLERRAFARCKSLKRMLLPRGLRSMGERVFEWCGLEHMELPDGVKTLPDYAFAQCRRLTRVSLPAGLQSVGHHAFYNCVALTGLELPQTVDFVGEGVFMNCKELNTMVLPFGVNLSVILADLTNDLDLTLLYPDGMARFFLPGYSYEYEDINAPRMWRTITYGSGQLYRECFSSRDVDFDLYEDYFDLALKQDPPAATTRIAWYRLRWPYGLNKGQEIYVNHLQQHCTDLMKLFLAQDDGEGLELFLNQIDLTPEQLDQLTRQAERAGNVRFVSRLLEKRGGTGGGADRDFDL